MPKAVSSLLFLAPVLAQRGLVPFIFVVFDYIVINCSQRLSNDRH